MGNDQADWWNLDVAFDSDAEAHDPEKVIAMAFGWDKSSDQGTTWEGKGQRPDGNPPCMYEEDDLTISVIDSSPNKPGPETVHVDIEFGPPEVPSPISDRKISVDLSLADGFYGTGVDILGRGNTCRKYQLINSGLFEVTITVTCLGI